MKVGIISVFMDYHRKGDSHRGVLQPQIGPLIAGLLPPGVDIDVINETWEKPNWDRDYDLLFISSLHSDFDRARQISHYWRRRGAKTVYGGTLASTYPQLCAPFFDAIAIGDPEGTVPQIISDFSSGRLQSVYVASAYDVRDIPVPRFDLAAEKQVVPLTLEATRGCPFACEFCALTGVGTRYQTRPVELVIRDIREGQRRLRGRIPSYKLNKVVFNDNNIGGKPGYLRQLCEALRPLKLIWGAAISFNALADLETVKLLSRSGCRFLFVGLESFNQQTLADMKKLHNLVADRRKVIDQCRRHGIFIESGLVLSPETDTCDYFRSIPRQLRDCGLHVPSFICFECPIPGTPHFNRLKAAASPAFLPNALLRDFNAYTLVTRPQKESVADFIAAYRWLLGATFTTGAKLRKLADDASYFLPGGYWMSMLVDLMNQVAGHSTPLPDRTFLAGTDVPPPEASSVPLEVTDFYSEEEYLAVTDPWRVTDSEGRVLPEWQSAQSVYGANGLIGARLQAAVRKPFGWNSQASLTMARLGRDAVPGD